MRTPSERYFFVWVNYVLKVLVYVEKGPETYVRIEDPKIKAHTK